MNNTVPTVTFNSAGLLQSDATVPRHVADTAACLSDDTRKLLYGALKARLPIRCADETAKACAMSAALELLTHGIITTPVSQITREA